MYLNIRVDLLVVGKIH
jgi:hypothetical protein